MPRGDRLGEHPSLLSSMDRRAPHPKVTEPGRSPRRIEVETDPQDLPAPRGRHPVHKIELLDRIHHEGDAGSQLGRPCQTCNGGPVDSRIGHDDIADRRIQVVAFGEPQCLGQGVGQHPGVTVQRENSVEDRA